MTAVGGTAALAAWAGVIAVNDRIASEHPVKDKACVRNVMMGSRGKMLCLTTLASKVYTFWLKDSTERYAVNVKIAGDPGDDHETTICFPYCR